MIDFVEERQVDCFDMSTSEMPCTEHNECDRFDDEKKNEEKGDEDDTPM